MLRKNLAILLAEILVAVLVFSVAIFPPHQSTGQVSNQQFFLPCTVETYGNAWNGAIAFGLSGPPYYFVVMSTSGTLLDVRSSSTGYGVVKNTGQDTLVFQGEPQVDGPPSAPTYSTHILNAVSNTTQDFPNVIGHHDLEYDPANNTFLTLQDYVKQVGNNSILFDKIVQFDSAGNVLWSWDTYNHIPLSEASTYDSKGNLTGFNETATINGTVVEDFTHANSLDWDYNNGIIYLNCRVTNTFYKINQTTGNIIWACGEFGNFTLLDNNGKAVSSLWYHSHDTTQVAPDVFTMFDNDFENITNPDDCHSRMIELTVNETSMTAYVDWSWEAPTQYWNNFAGGTTKLPNGDYLGDFGDPTHQLSQNKPWNFNDTGAVLIEVNPAGQIVRNITFPVGYYIYRVTALTNLSQNAFPTPTPSPSPSPTPSFIQSSPSPSASPTQTPSVQPSPSPTQTPPVQLSSPTQIPSVLPSLSPAQTPTIQPSLSPTPSPTPTQTPSIQPSPSSPSSSNLLIITGAAILIIAIIVTALAIPAYLKKRRSQSEHFSFISPFCFWGG